jgi:hypothetical protein
MKTTTSFLIILLLTFVVLGQDISRAKPCYLTIEESPVLSGLRLGMSSDDVLRVSETKAQPVKVDTEIRLKKGHNLYVEVHYGDVDYEKSLHKISIGETRLYLYSKKLHQLDGATYVYLSFYKNSLYTIAVVYDATGYKWKDAKEFIQMNEEKLGLPKDLWSSQPLANNGRESHLRCPDFTASHSISPGGVYRYSLSVSNKKVYALIKKEAKRLVIEKLEQELKNTELSKIENLEKKKTMPTAAATTISTTVAKQLRNIPVTGTEGDKSFSGTLSVERFVEQNAQIMVVGKLNGTVQGGTGVNKDLINWPVRIPVKVTSTTAGTTQAASAAVCPTLHLELGPDVDVFDTKDFKLKLDKILFDITAESGSRNLLGNLLCDIANLQNGGGALTQTVDLLNQIVGKLGYFTVV